MMRFRSVTKDLGLERERERENMRFRREDDMPWVFNHEIGRPRKKRESSGLR